MGDAIGERRMIIYPNQGAGLCNRLHAVANLIAFAEDTGQTVLILSLRGYAHYFSGMPEKGLFWYRSSNPRKRRLRVPFCWLRSGRFKQQKLSYRDPQVEPIIARVSLLLLTGWRFRDDDAMQKHAALIRRVFAPRPGYRESIDACLSAVRGRCDVLVGVHIRRTDYATFQNGRYCFADAVYRQWMEHLQGQMNRRVGFLIASDEPIDLAVFEGLVVQVAPGQELKDLYALASCDYLIGPPSTYTSWASYYGQVLLWHGEKSDRLPGLQDFRIHQCASST